MKQKNRILIVIAISTLLFSFVALSAQESGQGTLAGKNVNIYKKGGLRYVPLSEVSAILGLSASQGNGVITLDGRGQKVKLMTGRRVAIVNSSFIRFNGPTRNVGGVFCVPEDFISSVYNVSLGNTQTTNSPPPPTESTDQTGDTAISPTTIDSSVEVDLSLPPISPMNEMVDRVTQIRLNKTEDNTTLVLEFNHNVQKSIRLKQNIDASVLTITLPDTGSEIATSVIPIDNPYLTNIKYIKVGKEKVVIKITGKKPLTIRAFNSVSGEMKIVISQKNKDDDSQAIGEDEIPEDSVDTTSVELTGLKDITADILREGLQGIHAVIAVDPGHGGSDFGVSPGNKAKEKQIVMEVAAVLMKLLETAGQKPFLTRSGDYFMKYEQRVDLINEKKPDLLISLHCNAIPEEAGDGIRGVEVHYQLSSADLPATLTVDPKSANNDQMIMQQVKEILTRKNRQELYESSISLATKIDAQLRERSGSLLVRGIFGNDLLLLSDVDAPAVHVELGYLTDPIDTRRLLDPMYREQIALGIFYGIRDQLTSTKSSGGN